jgi:putative endonuclease
MYWTYIVECSDKTYYTGYSSDVYRRINEHNSGKGAKYTKTRRPVKLVYTMSFTTKGQALSEELRIKRITRKQKEALVKEYGKLHSL